MNRWSARGTPTSSSTRGRRWRGRRTRSAGLPRLALIATCSIGVDNIDLAVARELGILVCNQPGRTAPIVAEHALALLMAVAKRAAFFTASMRAGRWERMDTVYLNGKTLGVIGAGDIGGAVARLGRALGMNVVAWTPHPSPERAERLGVRFLALDELLALADAVSIHVKLTDQTRGLIGARELGADAPRRAAGQHRARPGGRCGGAQGRARLRPPGRGRPGRVRGGAAAGR